MAVTLNSRIRQLEKRMGVGGRSGVVPGTSLQRALLVKQPGNQPDGIGWVLGLGAMQRPLQQFYGKTIKDVMAEAEQWLDKRDSGTTDEDALNG